MAHRLMKGVLPLDQVLKYGYQVAKGWKAHKTGVIHRDLKPSNVMLTKTGAKLMGFGLAKATPATAPPSSSLTATVSGPSADRPLTAQGTLVGTFQYMSPEQLEGQDADARSEILRGRVLYEMATGTRAFMAKRKPASWRRSWLRSRRRFRRCSRCHRRRWIGGEGLSGEGSGRALPDRPRREASTEVDCGKWRVFLQPRRESPRRRRG